MGADRAGCVNYNWEGENRFEENSRVRYYADDIITSCHRYTKKRLAFGIGWIPNSCAEPLKWDLILDETSPNLCDANAAINNLI